MAAEFAYLTPGLEPELNALTVDELQHHFCAHLQSFLLDEYLGAAYLNRFLAEKDVLANPAMAKCFLHLMRKMVQLHPFHSGVRNLCSNLFNSPEEMAKANVLSKDSRDPSIAQDLQQMKIQGKNEELQNVLLGHVQKGNAGLFVAEMLLENSLANGFNLKWLHGYEPHPLFQNDWKAHIVFQAAKHGQADLAVELWEAAQSEGFSCADNTLNFVAASYAACGNQEAARKLYERSLELDSAQTTIKYLIKETDDPFVVRSSALDEALIPILIYSYNKAELLASTLASLCESKIGSSKIIVLLNGCTDNSIDVVRHTQKTYPDRSIELLNIPINMGAPAARNYLLDHVKKNYNFKHLAYLDDDVLLPPEWLGSLVTAIEEDPRIGVVGCRIHEPDDAIPQYLYRNLSIIKPGVFRLTLPKPLANRSIGLYEFRRDVDTVMGCCHLIRRECFEKVNCFDIQFSPSQLDDVAFHLDVVLNGWKVRYLGNLTCIHLRATGFQGRGNRTNGNALGNDVKFYYRFQNDYPDLTKRLQANTDMFMRQLA